jgi:hypothetical protein
MKSIKAVHLELYSVSHFHGWGLLSWQHKAQVAAKLSERLQVVQSSERIVSDELKQSIDAVSPLELDPNRNFLVRRGRGLGNLNQ